MSTRACIDMHTLHTLPSNALCHSVHLTCPISEHQRSEHQLQQAINTARDELRRREERLRSSIGRVCLLISIPYF